MHGKVNESRAAPRATAGPRILMSNWSWLPMALAALLRGVRPFIQKTTRASAVRRMKMPESEHAFVIHP